MKFLYVSNFISDNHGLKIPKAFFPSENKKQKCTLLLKTITMKKLLLVLTLIVLFAFDNPKLVKTKVSDEITISIPEDFREMTDDEIAKNYFIGRRPLKVFTDPSVKVNLGINESETPWGDDIDLLQKVYKKGITNAYPKLEMIKEEVWVIKKKKFAVFEFIGEVEPDENAIVQQAKYSKYHLILYTSFNDKVMIFNFSCASSQRKKWEGKAQQIMKSIRLSNLL